MERYNTRWHATPKEALNRLSALLEVDPVRAVAAIDSFEEEYRGNPYAEKRVALYRLRSYEYLAKAGFPVDSAGLERAVRNAVEGR